MDDKTKLQSEYYWRLLSFGLNLFLISFILTQMFRFGLQDLHVGLRIFWILALVILTMDSIRSVIEGFELYKKLHPDKTSSEEK